MSSSHPEQPIDLSFGGDVADFIGSLQAIETQQTYTHSLNPKGNPFEGKSLQEMIEIFASIHPGTNELTILIQRLDDFHGVRQNAPKPANLPEAYIQSRTSLEHLLQKNSEKSPHS